jgi:hypothetical protein
MIVPDSGERGLQYSQSSFPRKESVFLAMEPKDVEVEQLLVSLGHGTASEREMSKTEKLEFW